MNIATAKAYITSDVGTASEGQLLLRLYDKAISCLNLSMEALERGDGETVGRHTTRVLDIIHELMVSVNLDYQPVATNLLSLYSYMSQRVLKGCINRQAAPMREVVDMLHDLRSAWEAAVKKYPSPSTVEPAALAGLQESDETGGSRP